MVGDECYRKICEAFRGIGGSAAGYHDIAGCGFCSSAGIADGAGGDGAAVDDSSVGACQRGECITLGKVGAAAVG